MKYDVTVHYLTPKNTAKTKVYRDVEAGTRIAAKRQAKEMFAAGVHKPGYEISRLEAVLTGVRPEPCIETPRVFHVGDRFKLFGHETQIRSAFASRSGSKMFALEALQGPPMFRIISEHRLRLELEPPITTEYVSVYPNGATYTASTGPIQSSQYGVDQLIQIKVTKRGGKIIAK